MPAPAMLKNLLLAALVLAPAGSALAQNDSFFTNNQLAGIRNANSASLFSANRFRSQAIRNSVPRFAFSSLNQSQNTFSLTPGANKPFSSVNRSSSNVTPYLGLNNNPFGGVQDYYNVVRPQLQQQQQRNRFNRQQNQQARVEQAAAIHHHRLTQMAARNPYSTTGSEEYSGTGHPFVRLDMAGTMQNVGGYFPPPQGGLR
ncbi:MAG: hypothetical protein AAGA92_04535 [Planctomycetota bacterium]